MLINAEATETLRKVYTDMYQANKAENVPVFKTNLESMVTLCTTLLSEIQTQDASNPQLPKSPTVTPPESSTADTDTTQ